MDDQKVKEFITLAVQATKQENSGLIAHLRDLVKGVQFTVGSVDVELKKLNNRVAKQEEKQNAQSILNAQVEDRIAQLEKTHTAKDETERYYKRLLVERAIFIGTIIILGVLFGPEILTNIL